MNFVKTGLQNLLGKKRYLKLLSKTFFAAYYTGLLRKNPMYAAHYLVPYFIKPGDTILDIGANIGYYSKIFAALCGKHGTVKAVEPIALYRSILVQNVKQYPWVEILPFALGEKEDTITMGNPNDGGYRHGLMHVLSEKEKAVNTGETYEVPMRHPANLFEHLEKIAYIKCDIEGYEIPVIPLMEPLIARHLPIVQVETSEENLKELFAFFTSRNYLLFNAIGGKLVPFLSPEQHLIYDLFAIPKNQLAQYQTLIASNAQG